MGICYPSLAPLDVKTQGKALAKNLHKIGYFGFVTFDFGLFENEDGVEWFGLGI